MNNIELYDEVFKFIAVLVDCYNNTNFAKDRALYAGEIAKASSWLVDLKNKNSVEEVAKNIIDDRSSKFFVDYWKEGKWGDMQVRAFTELQSFVKSNGFCNQ